MWDKIAKIGLEAGKAYFANRGVDGTIEDAQKVFGWAKKGMDSLISSKTDEETDELLELDFEKVQEWTNDRISEIKKSFNEAKRHDITSLEFSHNANIALYTGYNAMNEMVDMECDVNESDFDTLISTYAQQIDSLCDQILMYIGQNCKGQMNTSKDVRIGGDDGAICMQVYGVYPVNFTYDMTMLVAVITNGILERGSSITLPDSERTVAEVSFISMFGKVVDGAEPGDLCCVALKGDYTDNLPNNSVFQLGSMSESASDNHAINNQSCTIDDSEKEYLDEFRACLEDGEMTSTERRLLNRLRESLSISEERALELEAKCCCNNLNPDEQEYANEVKACLEYDGRISDRERHLLSRLAKSLGITADRAIEIEKIVADNQ